MKVLTVRQPYAAMIVKGLKKIETRPWNTAFRGKLLIHSAKTLPRAWVFTDVVPATQWITGCIIGQVELVSVEPVEDILCRGLSDLEKRVGYYNPGMFGFHLQNACEFKTPIPASGKLSLWEYNL